MAFVRESVPLCFCPGAPALPPPSAARPQTYSTLSHLCLWVRLEYRAPASKNVLTRWCLWCPLCARDGREKQGQLFSFLLPHRHSPVFKRGIEEVRWACRLGCRASAGHRSASACAEGRMLSSVYSRGRHVFKVSLMLRVLIV